MRAATCTRQRVHSKKGQNTMACTTILVGKDASYDGSTIIARNEDSANGEFSPSGSSSSSPMNSRANTIAVICHLTIDLPDDPLQYTAVPNADLKEGIWGEAGVNEANVAMSATETLTTNERVLGADPLWNTRRQRHGKVTRITSPGARRHRRGGLPDHRPAVRQDRA